MQPTTTQYVNYQIIEQCQTSYANILSASMYLNGNVISIVIKFYNNPKHDKAIEELKSEVLMLKKIESINFPEGINAPKSLYYGQTTDNRLFHYIEKMPGRDIISWFDVPSRFFNSYAAKLVMTKEIIKAIEFLHKNNIAHCDIKPDNIILNLENDQVKISIIDFAFSKPITGEKEKYNFSGTKMYASPEVLNKRPYDLEAYDIWCFGATIMAIYAGDQDEIKDHIPSIDECIDNYVRFCYNSYKKGFIPQVICDILLRIFTKESERITMAEILNMLDDDDDDDLMDIEL